jgi:hypothetical protein
MIITTEGMMEPAIHSTIVNFIWGIADDVLRDVYVRGKYRDVILPMKLDLSSTTAGNLRSSDRLLSADYRRRLRYADAQAAVGATPFHC